MNRTHSFLNLVILYSALSASLQAQTPATRPIPRLPDGHVNLGSPTGELGVWVPPNAGDERLVDLDATLAPAADSFAIDTNPLQRTPRFNTPTPETTGLAPKLTLGQVPFQPWARALFEEHQVNQWEPHTRCKPSGGPRAFLTPYGVELMDKPELQRLYVVDIGGPHSMRVIYMDGRQHPANVELTHLGHSIGKWEKDTLVVDTVGFNESFWIDRHGMPHTDQLHLVERFTRLDFTTLHYEVTVIDPGAYTAPWTTALLLRWNSAQDLFEYVCQDNNLFPGLMLESPAANVVFPTVFP